MAYVVLARKYRPPDFGSLVGQEHVVQALSNALTQQRLHHAYLFTGTRGVGKTTVSRILAKSLNCTGADGRGGITAHPCGVCDACHDIDAGRFIDYVELDAASNRGVDEISQLLDQAVYKPVIGRFKVYMIDEVHMLSATAFNAMLKTLEEPPDYLKFVLATTDPQKIPPTVLSRCLQFNLRPMAPPTVQQHLAKVLADEQIAAEPGALRLLARAARGSMRDALSLTDQAIAFGAGHLTDVGVRQMLGAVDRSHAVRTVEALAAVDGAALIGAVDGLRSLGLSAAGTLEELAMLLQQMALLQVVPEAVDVDDPEAPDAARLGALLAADEIQLFYSIALHGRAELALAPDDYSGLVMVMLRMLAFRPRGEGRALPEPSAADTTAPTDSPRSARPLSVAVPVVAPGAAKATTPMTAPVVASVAAPIAAPLTAPARLSPRSEATARVRPMTQAVAEPPSVDSTPEPPPWLDAPFEHEVDAAFASKTSPAPAPAPAAALSLMAAIALDGAIPVAPRADPDAGTSASPPTAASSTAGDRWAQVVGELNEAGRLSAFARELAMQAQCTSIDEQHEPIRLRLRVERDNLRAAGPCEKLQAALAQHLGRPVVLEVDAGRADDSAAKRDLQERTRRQTLAEQIIHDDPLVKSLMAQYKTARIVPGSVKPL